MAHFNTGRKQSPEHIAKRVAILRAKGVYEAQAPTLITRNKARTGEKRSLEYRKKKSADMMGRSTAWLKGLKRPEEFRRKLSDYWLANPEKHNHYIDGKYAERNGERTAAMKRLDYRLWREAVFNRDDWTCVDCGERGGMLHADHIKTWKNFPELRYAVENGRTLCVSCHKKTPTFAKSGKTLARIEGLLECANG